MIADFGVDVEVDAHIDCLVVADVGEGFEEADGLPGIVDLGGALEGGGGGGGVGGLCCGESEREIREAEEPNEGLVHLQIINVWKVIFAFVKSYKD